MGLPTPSHVEARRSNRTAAAGLEVAPTLTHLEPDPCTCLTRAVPLDRYAHADDPTRRAPGAVA